VGRGERQGNSWLAPRGDRLDNVRRQEGERQDKAEVPIADPLDGGEFGDAAGLTRDERLEQRWARLSSFSRTGSGFAGAAEGPSTTSRIVSGGLTAHSEGRCVVR